MAYKVIITDPLEKEGVEIFTKEKNIQVDVQTKLSPQDLKNVIKDYDAIVIRSGTKVTKEIIEAGKKLKVIGRAGVGLDNVDVEAATKNGVIVVNAPAGNTISTAELTMSLILSLSRNIPRANMSLLEGKWERKAFTGVELYGKTLGVVGLGRIGKEVAKRALSFGMKIVAYDPFLSQERDKKLSIDQVDLATVLKTADYITVHTPLTEDTTHMIGEKEFAIMKDGVRIINCARGGIIDEVALEKALKSGKVAGAAIDVFEKEPPVENPLIKYGTVVATPHLGASTKEAQLNVAIDIADTVKDVLLGKAVRNAVNVPSLEPEVYKVLKPYIDLSEKMGLLMGQIIEDKIQQISIRYVGELANVESSPITVAFIKGVLAPILQETVNYVNALSIAKDRGIKVLETKVSEIEDFANLIVVEIKTDKDKRAIMGTLFTKVDPRIVKIDAYYVDAIPHGHMLYISNKDVPGIVGQIGTILGENNINIAEMTFGREKKTGTAVTLLNVDSPVSKDVLSQIRKAKNVFDAKIIKI